MSFISSFNIFNTNKYNSQKTSKYYAFSSGWKAVACENFDKPWYYIQTNFTRLEVISTLFCAILIIPAIIGSPLSKIIYFTCGEKIKENDYTQQRNEWIRIKKGCMRDNSQALNKLIDFCISYKIKAEECTHNLFLLLTISDERTSRYTYDFDATTGYSRFEDVIDSNMKKLPDACHPIVLIDFRNKHEENCIRKKIRSDDYPTTEFLRKSFCGNKIYYPAVDQTEYLLLPKGHFLPRTRKYANYVKQQLENKTAPVFQ